MPKPENWLEDFSSICDTWTGTAIGRHSVKHLVSTTMAAPKLRKKPDLPMHMKQIQWEKT